MRRSAPKRFYLVCQPLLTPHSLQSIRQQVIEDDLTTANTQVVASAHTRESCPSGHRPNFLIQGQAVEKGVA